MAPAPWSGPSRTRATWSAPAPTWSGCSTGWWSPSWGCRDTVIASSPPSRTPGCRFPDGSSYASFLDPAATVEHLRRNGFSERDIEGRAAYEAAFERCRTALRHGPAGDTWVGSSPSRERIEELLGNDPELVSIVFEESIAETISRYMEDERLHHALFGQGVTGAYAGPRDPGTASVKLMHHQGDLLGYGSFWGYVEGGMGRVSFSIADAAIEAGAQLACGVPVGEIVPGEGVRLESGELLRSRAVLSNAEPKRTLSLIDLGSVPATMAERVAGWKTRSPVVKLNAALGRVPSFTARGRGDLPGALDGDDHARARRLPGGVRVLRAR